VRNGLSDHAWCPAILVGAGGQVNGRGVDRIERSFSTWATFSGALHLICVIDLLRRALLDFVRPSESPAVAAHTSLCVRSAPYDFWYSEP